MNKSEIDTLNGIARALRMNSAALREGRYVNLETALKDMTDLADYIEALVRPHMEASAGGYIADITAREVVTKVQSLNRETIGAHERINAIDARLAALESSVRLHGHRIDAARESMRECATNDRLHNSVRFLADTLAINLGSNPAPAPETPR